MRPCRNDAAGTGGPGSVGGEVGGARQGEDRPVGPAREPVRPSCYEAGFQKAQWGGRDTSAARYLRTGGVDTLATVSFSLKSCALDTRIGEGGDVSTGRAPWEGEDEATDIPF